MKLIEIVNDIGDLGDEDVIVAKPDWSINSEARVVRLTEDYRVPKDAIDAGFRYFLEIPTARQVLEEMEGATYSPEQKCLRLIEYAVYDA